MQHHSNIETKWPTKTTSFSSGYFCQHLDDSFTLPFLETSSSSRGIKYLMALDVVKSPEKGCNETSILDFGRLTGTTVVVNPNQQHKMALHT